MNIVYPCWTNRVMASMVCVFEKLPLERFLVSSFRPRSRCWSLLICFIFDDKPSFGHWNIIADGVDNKIQ